MDKTEFKVLQPAQADAKPDDKVLTEALPYFVEYVDASEGADRTAWLVKVRGGSHPRAEQMECCECNSRDAAQAIAEALNEQAILRVRYGSFSEAVKFADAGRGHFGGLGKPEIIVPPGVK